MEILVLLAAAVAGLTSLVCFIIVLIGMFKQEESIIHGLVALLCCQLYAFIWGWAKWESGSKMLVMAIWTVAIVVGFIAQVVIGGMQQSSGF